MNFPFTYVNNFSILSPDFAFLNGEHLKVAGFGHTVMTVALRNGHFTVSTNTVVKQLYEIELYNIYSFVPI